MKNKNYLVVCESNRIKFEGTLGECFEEVRHSAPFRIVNSTTEKTVLVRSINGFRPAKRFFEAYPEKSARLENSRKFFIL